MANSNINPELLDIFYSTEKLTQELLTVTGFLGGVRVLNFLEVKAILISNKLTDLCSQLINNDKKMEGKLKFYPSIANNIKAIAKNNKLLEKSIKKFITTPVIKKLVSDGLYTIDDMNDYDVSYKMYITGLKDVIIANLQSIATMIDVIESQIVKMPDITEEESLRNDFQKDGINVFSLLKTVNTIADKYNNRKVDVNQFISDISATGMMGAALADSIATLNILVIKHKSFLKENVDEIRDIAETLKALQEGIEKYLKLPVLKALDKEYLSEKEISAITSATIDVYSRIVVATKVCLDDYLVLWRKIRGY